MRVPLPTERSCTQGVPRVIADDETSVILAPHASTGMSRFLHSRSAALDPSAVVPFCSQNAGPCPVPVPRRIRSTEASCLRLARWIALHYSSEARKKQLLGADIDRDPLAGRHQLVAAQDRAQQSDALGRPVGQVLQGAGLDLAVLAIALAQQNGGRRAAVWYGRDVHAVLRTASLGPVERKTPRNMPTDHDPVGIKLLPSKAGKVRVREWPNSTDWLGIVLISAGV